MKKILSPGHIILTAALCLLLLFAPLLLRSSELGVYESPTDRQAMFAAHAGLITEDYLQQALAAYRALPWDIFSDEPYFSVPDSSQEASAQWLLDLNCQLNLWGIPSFSFMGYTPQDAESPILPADYIPHFTYADLDGARLLLSLWGGIGALIALALPVYLLSPLLNGEISCGMRRVILTIAGSETAQIRAKWLVAATVAALSALLVPFTLTLGTVFSTGLPNTDLSAAHIGISRLGSMPIGLYFALRWCLLTLGCFTAAFLCAGASGIFSQPVAAMVCVLALFLFPLLPLPMEAPAWLVTVTCLGPMGLFSGDATEHFSPHIALLHSLFWPAAAALCAVIGRIRLRSMKIPEEYFKA